MAVYHVYCILVKPGLASIDLLSLPVHYWKVSDLVSEICKDLWCFPLLDELDDVPEDCPFGIFEEPIVWVATMLFRSTTDRTAVLVL